MKEELTTYILNWQKKTEDELNEIETKITEAMSTASWQERDVALENAWKKIYECGYKFIPHYISRIFTNFLLLVFFVFALSLFFAIKSGGIFEKNKEEHIDLIRQTSEYIKKIHPELASSRIEPEEILAYVQKQKITANYPELLASPSLTKSEDKSIFAFILGSVRIVISFAFFGFILMALVFLRFTPNYHRYRKLKKIYKHYRNARLDFLDFESSKEKFYFRT